jgi:hypothetical protein
MTQNVQTSVFTHSRLHGKRYYAGNLYTVRVNGEDNEYYEFEVEADTFAEATELAENMAYDLMVNVTYVEVYKA